MRRLPIALLAVFLLGITGGTAAAQSPPPGPPYPEPIEGVYVYDHAGVLAPDTIASLQASIMGIWVRTRAQIVVYTQVKPDSDTPDEAERDAAALIDQWGVGQAGIDDGLAILFDLDQSRCHGQVQLYAGPGYREAFLTNEERQAIFEEEMVPALRECDFDTALLAAMERLEAAESRAAPIATGTHIEVREASFSIRPPIDWLVIPRNTATPSRLGEHRYWLDLAIDPPNDEESGRCQVSTYDWSGVSLEAFVADYIAIVAGSSLKPTVTPVDLPAGRAARLDGGALGSATSYVLMDGSTAYVLRCSAGKPPADHWLSIAESIEFDDADPTAGTEPGSGLRSTDSEAGFAITLPDGWRIGLPGGPITAGGGQQVLGASEPDEGACRVWWWPGGDRPHADWSDLDSFGDAFVARFRSALPGSATATLDLPAGPAIRVDDLEPETGWSRSVYLLTSGSSYYSLTCFGPDPPDDRWLSIAETSEFLPAEDA